MNKIYLTDEETNYLYRTLQLEEIDLDAHITMQKELLAKVSSPDYDGHIEKISVYDKLYELLEDKIIVTEIISKIKEYM